MLRIEKYNDDILQEFKNLCIDGDKNASFKLIRAIKNVAKAKENITFKKTEDVFKWLQGEYKAQILTGAEKKYIYSIMKMTHSKPTRIMKKTNSFRDTSRIEICFDAFSVCSPCFKTEERYKKMEFDREYTLEELGL